jgi:hypothetical protein
VIADTAAEEGVHAVNVRAGQNFGEAQAQVLGRISSIDAVGGDQFDSVLLEFWVQFVGVVGIVSDQILRCLGDNHLDQRRSGQLHFMRSCVFDAYGNRKAMTVCHGHDLRSLTTFRFANFRSPFFAGAKLPSMKASRTSS